MEDWRLKRETDFVVHGLLPQPIITLIYMHRDLTDYDKSAAQTLRERRLTLTVMDQPGDGLRDEIAGRETVDGFM